MDDPQAAVELARVYAIRHDNGTFSYGVKMSAFLGWLHPDQCTAMLHHGAVALKEVAETLGPMPGPTKPAPSADVVHLVPDAPRD